MIVKDNETILDTSANTSPITWQNKIWITEKNIKIENDQDKDRILLIDMDKDEIYQVDKKNKTYKKMTVPEEIKDLQGERKIKSQKMNQTKKFGEWDCYGVQMNTDTKDVSLEGEYWLTKQVNIPFPLRKKVAKYFGFDQKRLTDELEKYEGYPVYVSLTMTIKDKKIKMKTLVMEVKKLEIDPKTFEIPADFKFMDITQKNKEDAKIEELKEELEKRDKMVVDPKE